MDGTAPHINDVAAAERMFGVIAQAPHEVAVFAYLNRQRQVLAMRHTPSNRVDRVALPIREVVADSLAFDAAALIMGHNHPSGDPRPSDGDIAATRMLDRALAAIDVRLIDHLIVTRDGVTSFRQLGLL